MSEEDFAKGDAGAAGTTPLQCGELKKGSFVMIKDKPCKIVDMSTSKTGKHGHAKAHITALDIFTNKKLEDLCPCSHNMSQPVVVKTEMQVLNADPDTGEVSLLTEDGGTKDDVNLPNKDTMGVAPEQQSADEKLAKEIVEAVEKGEKSVMVVVQAACDMEKIISMKLI